MQWCSGEGKRGAGEGAAQRVSDHFQKLYSTFGIWSTRMFVSLWFIRFGFWWACARQFFCGGWGLASGERLAGWPPFGIFKI